MLEVYLGSSFSTTNNEYSYGIIFVDRGREVCRIATKNSANKYINSHNIAGELSAAIDAINWAISNDYNEITIYSEYEGTKEFTTGGYTPQKQVSKDYKKIFDKLNSQITIRFGGNSNSNYMEEADILSKASL